MNNDYDMPVIEGIDWEKAHRYMPTKETLMDVLKEMVAGGAKQTDILLQYRDAVKETPSDENCDLFKVQAHALKASLRSIGSDLFDEGYALEIAGRDRDTESIINNTETFVKHYLELCEKLRIITGDADKKGSFDKEEFTKMIEDIKDAMDSFDIERLQEATGKVLSMETPDELKDELVILEEAVRDLESEKVTSCCERIEELMR